MNIALSPTTASLAKRLMIPVTLVAATILSFAPALAAGFVTWDDDINFLTNQAYRGLDAERLHWMWTTFLMGHYTPLTWMTLGLDYTLWGMDARGYHATNVLIHAVNAVLLYLFTRRLLLLGLPQQSKRQPQGVTIAAVIASLLFATHPLRVESVAWITERRDVLSCFFYLLTVILYLQAVGGERLNARWYWSSVAACLCALLSKATAMSLPVALLLVDIYPLQRVRATRVDARRVALELAPFFVLALSAAVVSVIALHANHQLTIPGKIAVSAYGFAFYLWKTIAPVHLSPLYPMPDRVDPLAPRFVAGYIVTVLYVAVAWFLRRRWPGVSIGMLAFVAIMLPMLGAVQNGNVIAADRYTYHAATALSIIVGAMFLAAERISLRVRAAFSAVIIIALATATWNQTTIWHDSRAFWTYTAAMTDSSSTAHAALGRALYADGELAASVQEFEIASHIDPMYPDGYNNAGIALAQLGRWREAIADYEKALVIHPKFGPAESNLGVALAALGQTDAALVHYANAVSADSTNADAEINWGNALIRINRLGEAVAHYESALRIQPRNTDAEVNLGVALARQGSMDAAIDAFHRALEINPRLVEARQFLDRAETIKRQRAPSR